MKRETARQRVKNLLNLTDEGIDALLEFLFEELDERQERHARWGQEC